MVVLRTVERRVGPASSHRATAKWRSRSVRSMIGVVAALLAATSLYVGCTRRSGQARAGPERRAPAASHPATNQQPAGDPRLADARAALQKGDFLRALELAKQARGRGVPAPAVLEMEGDVFRQTSYLDREIEALRQWTKAAPRDAIPWLRLFYIYADLGWTREAGDAAARALKLAPTNPRAYVARALVSYRSNEPQFGIKYAQEAQRLDPNNREILDLRVSILLKSRRFQEAEAIMRQELARDPQNLADKMKLSEALYGEGKLPESEALLRDIQRAQPDDLETAYQLGMLAYQRGDLTEATRQFERVAAKNAQYSKTLWYLGRIRVQQGRAEEGRKMLKMFQTMDNNTGAYFTAIARLRSRPNDAGIHYELAKHHLGDEEYPEAIVELRRVLELRPHDQKAEADLITALAQQGRITEA